MTTTNEQVYIRVCQIYRDYRTTILNKKYYGHQLSKYQKINRALEIVIAIGTASSGGVAGWAIWSDVKFSWIWAIFAGFATLVAVALPILNFNKRIENYSKLYAGHSKNEQIFRSMVE